MDLPFDAGKVRRWLRQSSRAARALESNPDPPDATGRWPNLSFGLLPESTSHVMLPAFGKLDGGCLCFSYTG